MAEESFLLVSLKENKSKKLAQVISNETSRLILDYLTRKQATETEISKNLNLPISTVHYNLQQLLNAGLVTVEEFHYSEKGKEVNHYKLSNKFIIIAPTVTETIKQRLKKLLPVTLIALAAAGGIELYSSLVKGGSFVKTVPSQVLQEGLMAAAREAEITTTPDIGLWFLFGALFAIAILLIAETIKKK